ncbi:MAG: 23S rRNA (guanosine(2251)-2'-O)-methyltransferase RlmB [Bacilli bacterium]|nr:23S rRNA (guanosine(2251)-2'-O)-methyltransferase RlmB [Bacilli bacterium]
MGNKIVSTNAIRGAIESNYCVEIFATEKSKQNNLITLAEKKGIKINLVTKEKLDSIFGHNHQGICAYAKPVYTVGLEEIIHDAKKKENPIVVMLDELTDPHNLGAILRTCDAFNISGVVYKKRGNVSLNETVVKISTGASYFVKCAEVSNLSNAIKTFKKNGFWAVALDGDSNMVLKDVPHDVPLLVVVGSEGYGISRLNKENCDMIAKIPMFGKVNCLNASVACSIALYELRR